MHVALTEARRQETDRIHRITGHEGGRGKVKGETSALAGKMENVQEAGGRGGRVADRKWSDGKGGVKSTAEDSEENRKKIERDTEVDWKGRRIINK